ncbi:DUF4190 domain-containing protein [Parablautia muri]|nr:zinc-ribbon domain-containing protein [Parablautia muri]
MSGESKMIYCTQCGKGNAATSKFCSNCGAKLEQPSSQDENDALRTEGAFSGESASEENTVPAYERITDAEEEKPASPYQEEIKINYGTGQSSGYYSNDNGGSSYYDSQASQYYTGGLDEGKQGGGNIGFAIASLVCGIISLVCCCLGLFSAVLGIAAIVLGIITLCFKYDGKGMAIAGIITGGLALVFVIFAMIIGSSSAYYDMIEQLTNGIY